MRPRAYSKDEKLLAVSSNQSQDLKDVPPNASAQLRQPVVKSCESVPRANAGG